jgi:hypothetical protein
MEGVKGVGWPHKPRIEPRMIPRANREASPGTGSRKGPAQRRGPSGRKLLHFGRAAGGSLEPVFKLQEPAKETCFRRLYALLQTLKAAGNRDSDVIGAPIHKPFDFLQITLFNGHGTIDTLVNQAPD